MNKIKGAPKGVGEVLYRELGAQLKEDGVKEVSGTVISPEPLAIRKKVFGEFKSVDVNGEPVSYGEALATAERIKNRTENEAAAIEPVNTISETTKFSPKKKSRSKEELRAVDKRATPTGWILPNRTFVPLNTAFHEQFLAENAKDLNKRFGTKFSDTAILGDKLDALNKGFVRFRFDSRSGNLLVEANADTWPKVKPAVKRKLHDYADVISSFTISILNARALEVDSVVVHRLHELSGPQRDSAIDESIDSLRVPAQ